MSDGTLTAAENENQSLQFAHHGKAGELFGLVAINFVLNIITLLFYRFWAKTRVRAYLWRRTALGGDAMEYSGTGKEMFIGFLVAFGAVILPLVVLKLVALFMLGQDSPLMDAIHVALYALVIFLVGVAQYRARRYRLSRTHWRGIRAAQTGPAWLYGLKALGFYVLLPLTLTWSYPWQAMNLTSHMMNHTWFGDRRFSFAGSAGPLYANFAIAWLSMALILLGPISLIVALGGAQAIQQGGAIQNNPAIILVFLSFFALPLIYAWYLAGQYRHMASCTRYEGLSFTFEASGASLVKLALGNMLIMIVTLGFGLAFTQMRKFRYFCDHMLIAGDADFDAIRQSAEQRPTIGEGLADAFDVGSI